LGAAECSSVGGSEIPESNVTCDRERMRLEPKSTRDLQRIKAKPVPPRCFIATAMQFAVVAATQRNSELVAHLAG
jgi:hypothetical protein